jgi:nitroimidazol reductase NimA-like FMN-containing flavoprotein (pyridoxamine 5'-phosphate oxidase superfamily)
MVREGVMSSRGRPRPSDRIRVRRNPKKGHYDRTRIEGILDRSLVGHIAFLENDEPVCIPMLYARVGDRVYVHGSRASRMMRVLSGGGPACLTVTVVDGLVLARSVFEHSANYESVVAFGRFTPVDEPAERLAALEAFTEKVLPGRWSEVRPPSRQELKATTILSMTIDEAAAKVRSGPPDDDDSEDAALDVWAGEIPIVSSFDEPIASPGLRAGIPLPTSVSEFLARSQSGKRRRS